MAMIWNPYANDEEGGWEDDGAVSTPQVDPGLTQLDLSSIPVSSPGGNSDLAALHNDTAYTGGTDAEIAKMVADAKASGAGTSVLDILKGWGKTAGGVLDSATAWVAANPALAKMIGGGLSNAQQQQYAQALAAQRNQWDIDKTNAANARQDQLWQRRNDSITGAHAADLGIIGRAMIDPTLYARK